MTDHTHDEDFTPDFDQVSNLLDNVQALSEEHKTMLLNTTLARVHDMLTTAIQTEDPNEVKGILMLAASAVAFAGSANNFLREAHEEWTSTGDKSVDRVWDQYADTIRNGAVGVLKGSDLPEGVAERIAAGEATDEDYAAVKALISQRTGKDPGEIEVDVQVVGAPQASDRPAEVYPGSNGAYL